MCHWFSQDLYNGHLLVPRSIHPGVQKPLTIFQVTLLVHSYPAVELRSLSSSMRAIHCSSVFLFSATGTLYNRYSCHPSSWDPLAFTAILEPLQISNKYTAHKYMWH